MSVALAQAGSAGIDGDQAEGRAERERQMDRAQRFPVRGSRTFNLIQKPVSSRKRVFDSLAERTGFEYHPLNGGVQT
jgi:hypothetical protein